MMENFNLRLPLVQAPMAGGATTPELVAAVSNAGALGFLGAAMLDAAQIRQQAAQIKAATSRPFGINLFVLSQQQCLDVSAAIPQWLAQVYQHCSLPFPQPKQAAPLFEQQFDALLEIAPAVASFAFGILNAEQIKALKQRNIVIAGTVNCVEEARQWEAVGADILVVQGREAGGHQGGFLPVKGEAQDLLALLSACRQASKLPLWAAGGLMTGADIATVCRAGACAAQMGTAFLSSQESGIHAAYKRLLTVKPAAPTAFTRLWSGKTARGIVNGFLREQAQFENATLPYPLHNAFTAPLRKFAAEQDDVDLMSLWAGAHFALCREMKAADLVETLYAEYCAALAA